MVQEWVFVAIAAELLLVLVQVKVAFLVTVPVLVLRIGSGYRTECNWGRLGLEFPVYTWGPELRHVCHFRKLLLVHC